MFLIDVRYVAPLEDVDKALEGHVAFLKENYAKGIFVLSGRKIPRTGGVILARNVSREELDVKSPKSLGMPHGALIALGSICFLGLSSYFVS